VVAGAADAERLGCRAPASLTIWSLAGIAAVTRNSTPAPMAASPTRATIAFLPARIRRAARGE
jgi:hypothetical protein